MSAHNELIWWSVPGIVFAAGLFCTFGRKVLAFFPGESPQLPAGHSAMALLALIPRLWFAVMDPRVPVAG